jgi:hypothetical protein
MPRVAHRAYGWSVAAEKVDRVLTREEFNAMFRDAPLPTDDDVSIASDGRRLDSREAVIAFFASLDAEDCE